MIKKNKTAVEIKYAFHSCFTVNAECQEKHSMNISLTVMTDCDN